MVHPIQVPSKGVEGAGSFFGDIKYRWLTRPPRLNVTKNCRVVPISKNVLTHPGSLPDQGWGVELGGLNLRHLSCLTEGTGKKWFLDIEWLNIPRRANLPLRTVLIIQTFFTGFTSQSEVGWGGSDCHRMRTVPTKLTADTFRPHSNASLCLSPSLLTITFHPCPSDWLSQCHVNWLPSETPNHAQDIEFNEIDGSDHWVGSFPLAESGNKWIRENWWG